jgi:DNA (cytosine-5)-methyltransferase 1
MPKPTAVDLFSGCGGLTLGLRRAGYRVLAAIDADELAAETYKLNNPRTKLLVSDIKKVDPAALMEKLGLKAGGLDLLAGCPPCQGFSRIRTLNGALAGDKEKNRLVWSFMNFVECFQPKMVMLENVPGLAKDHRLHKITGRLKKMGYTVEYAVRNASDFEVPQERNRLVLVAAKGFTVALASARPEKLSVKAAIGDLVYPRNSDDPLHNYKQTRSKKVADIIRAIPKNGGSRSMLPEELVLPCHRKMDGFKDVYGRMSWGRPSPTITGGCINPSKGRFLHPSQNRAITLREASLLQGFPETYKFSLSRGCFPAAVMIGNAFPPRFAEIHARSLAKQLRSYAKRYAGKRHERKGRRATSS